MEPISTIRISNPSVALVNIINNALKQKKDRMRQMREKIAFMEFVFSENKGNQLMVALHFYTEEEKTNILKYYTTLVL